MQVPIFFNKRTIFKWLELGFPSEFILPLKPGKHSERKKPYPDACPHFWPMLGLTPAGVLHQKCKCNTKVGNRTASTNIFLSIYCLLAGGGTRRKVRRYLTLSRGPDCRPWPTGPCPPPRCSPAESFSSCFA